MITIFSQKIKSFSQNNYDHLIRSIDFHKLSCTCGQKANLVKHGYYKRSLKVASSLITLSILRVKCNSCNRTHALLPSCIIPYSQVSYEDHLSIIHIYLSHSSFEPLMLHNLLIDEGTIRYIIRQYLAHWKERIASFAGVISDSLLFPCFKFFKRQFMQIKCTPNCLFS